MIKIDTKVIKNQPRFWNHCLFHPTDAIEDSWGKRILDRMAEDKSIGTIRIYTMFEDIVYIDMNGKLQYDFRANDLRLEYLIEKGFNVLLAFAAMPDCIAQNTNLKTTVSFKKTRYKGKFFNTSIPKDYSLWEEVCYEYTKHIVEKFGIEQVSKWQLQCFNEPDIPDFFMSDLPHSEKSRRLEEYCKLYEAFVRGIERVSSEIKIGGPCLALYIDEFLKPWLEYVKKNNLKLDFISYHNYGCLGFIEAATLGLNALNVDNHFNKHKKLVKTVKECGFEHIPIVIDEWGAVGGGFKNITQVPELIFRETEVFAAYFAKLIYRYVYSDYIVDKLMLCLSGQHEMENEFTGFRGFFTLNNAAKPIYNAFVMASKMGGLILDSKVDNKNVFAVPTKNENGDLAVLISYSSDDFEENLPNLEETLEFSGDLSNKTISVFCIDKNTTNPFRLWEKEGCPELDENMISRIREESRLKPITTLNSTNSLKIKLTSNCTYLITVK